MHMDQMLVQLNSIAIFYILLSNRKGHSINVSENIYKCHCGVGQPSRQAVALGLFSYLSVSVINQMTFLVSCFPFHQAFYGFWN